MRVKKMISIEDFRPVTLGDRSLLMEHFSRYPMFHSENLFMTLVSWTHYVPAFYLFKEGNLLLMNLKDGKPQFRLPMGERNDALLEEVLDVAKKEGGPRPIAAVEGSCKDWVESVYPKLKFTSDRDFFDYVYLAKDLAGLPGKGYLTQRNKLNRFRKQYVYSVEPVSQKNIEDVGRFLKRWCIWRDCSSNPMLEAERTAIMFCMEHFFEMGLSGIVLRIGGEVQALSVYEGIGNDTAAVHFEKAMPDFDGIYPAINNEAAKILVKDYKFINRESDLGIAGLRTAKERLHPDHMVKIYYIDKADF
jgi:hypothetical protein